MTTRFVSNPKFKTGDFVYHFALPWSLRRQATTQMLILEQINEDGYAEYVTEGGKTHVKFIDLDSLVEFVWARVSNTKGKLYFYDYYYEFCKDGDKRYKRFDFEEYFQEQYEEEMKQLKRDNLSKGIWNEGECLKQVLMDNYF